MLENAEFTYIFSLTFNYHFKTNMQYSPHPHSHHGTKSCFPSFREVLHMNGKLVLDQMGSFARKRAVSKIFLCQCSQ